MRSVNTKDTFQWTCKSKYVPARQGQSLLWAYNSCSTQKASSILVYSKNLRGKHVINTTLYMAHYSTDFQRLAVAGSGTAHNISSDVEAFKAAMEECMQQSQNLLVGCCWAPVI